jgi:leucyl-tRNA synthetase
MDFIQLFNSWYKDNDKAEDVSALISIFEKEGNATVNAVCDDKIAVLRQVTAFARAARESFTI